jgi:mono/diheme cytochrome c family protein
MKTNRLARPAAAAVIVAAALAVAGYDLPVYSMGMPGLDATKPLGAAPAQKSTANPDETVPPAFTDAQVSRGHTAYDGNCAECHGPNLNDGEFGGAPLNGSYFRDHWGGLTVDALYGFLSSAMPPDRPGRLSPQTYADITAFILERNGYKSGSQELTPDLDAQSKMALSQE